MTLAGKTVLVTGADGFIGSHLAEALVARGASVRALCLYNSFGSHGWLDTIPREARAKMDLRFGDVRDSRLMQNVAEGADTVFHLAALIAIPYSYVAPESFVDTNVKGTLNVLEAVRANGCRRMINTSTSEVYGTPQTVPISESHALRGQSPYSASKIAADQLCEAFHASFDVPVVVLRPFNTYGPRQSARAVIPTILSQLLSGKTRIRLGSLSPKRDLTFVDDTVNGIIAAATADGVVGQTIQLGTGRTESIGEIVKMAQKVCGVSELKVEEDAQRVRPDKSEVKVLLSDPAKAASMLGWKAAVGLEEGLRKTADWIRANLDRYEPDSYAI